MDQVLALLDEPWVLGAGMVVFFGVFVAALWGAMTPGRSAARFGPEDGDWPRRATPLRAYDSGEAEKIDRYLLPRERSERWQVTRLLHRAGFRGSGTLRNFYLVRVFLAVLLPVLAVLIVSTLPVAGNGGALQGRLNSFLVATILSVAVGFYVPLLFVRWRAAERLEQMRRSFPDALDLLHVMVQAGLGMDAAMQRVGEEMSRSRSPLADEFKLYSLEVRAGKTREQALQDFAERIGLDQVRAFTTVLSQSLRFGTSVSDALEVFSIDMRNERMMGAEEKANKLPVQMSIVLVLCMLPAIMAMVLGPIAIRAIRVIFPAMN